MMADPIPLAFRQHDHSGCVRQAVQEARRICTRAGSRLTPLRSRVFELLWNSHRPLGAYDLLELMPREPGSGNGRATPASVYRALDFLREHGLVHRIECRNAYIGCVNPERPHRSQFLICTECGHTLELASRPVGEAIESAALASSFAISGWTIEIAGRCPSCRGLDS